MKISGLDEFSRTFDDAQKALASLDSDIAKISFDSGDQASITRAIQTVNQAIDQKIMRYRDNPIVKDIADQMKVSYAEEIRERASKESSES